MRVMFPKWRVRWGEEGGFKNNLKLIEGAGAGITVHWCTELEINMYCTKFIGY